MRPPMQLVATVAIAAVPIFSMPAAIAQNQPAQGQRAPSQPGQQMPSAANIPDAKLDAAAAAIDHVASIKQNYEQKMASAAPADKDKIAGDANSAIQKAITDQGLSVEEYTSILQVAQNDPNVRTKLLQRLHPAAQ
jgi:predicted TIM-barrel fold metal-dependent hydrolase